MRELISLPDSRRLDLFVEGPSSGTPLLFHHGSPASGLPAAAFVAPLAERDLRYVAWSRPGYGDSTRQPGRAVADVLADAAAVLDHIGADRAYTLGWSGGGPHAMATAAGLPDRILGATTIGGVAPYPAEGIDWFEGMGPENIEEFGASLESPEALIAFKERAWPIWSVVTGDEIAEAFGGEISPLNRELPILIPNFNGQFLGWRPWHYEKDRSTKKATTVSGGPKTSGASIQGWRAEFFIPYLLLRPLQNVPPKPGSRWRFNVYRMDHDDGKRTQWDWAPVGDSFHEFEKYGDMIFADK